MSFSKSRKAFLLGSLIFSVCTNSFANSANPNPPYDTSRFFKDIPLNIRVSEYHGPKIEFSPSFYITYLMKHELVDKFEFEEQFFHLTEEGQQFLLSLAEKEKEGKLIKWDAPSEDPEGDPVTDYYNKIWKSERGTLEFAEYSIITGLASAAILKRQQLENQDPKITLLNSESRIRDAIIALYRLISFVNSNGLDDEFLGMIENQIKRVKSLPPSNSQDFNDLAEEMISIYKEHVASRGSHP